jgi:hypothetical protein
MGRCIARMGANGHLEGVACFVVLALLCVQHSQIVVGLGEFGVVLGQLLEHYDGLGTAVEFGQYNSLEKTDLSVPRLGGENAVCAFKGLGELPLFDQGLQILDGVGPDRAADQTCEKQGGGQGSF